MAIYFSQQIVGPTPGNIMGGSSDVGAPQNLASSAQNYPRDVSDIDHPDYQQIVIPLGNSNNFLANTDYYVKLTLPKNKNFALQYGVRLLQLPNGAATDLDGLDNYQLIKYITVPYSSQSNQDYDTVVLYQVVGSSTTYSAILISDETSKGIDSQADLEDEYDDAAVRAGRMFETANGIYYVYDNDGEIIDGWEDGKKVGDDFNKNQIIMIHTWVNEDSDEESVFEFTIRPTVNIYNAIYLYLIPRQEDNDILWKLDGVETQYFGRHIDVSKVECEIYKLNNLVSGIQGVIRNIGVWGRSELIMCINGAEIKIGPSGYYELRDYDITSLSIATYNNTDKYTVDIQSIQS